MTGEPRRSWPGAQSLWPGSSTALGPDVRRSGRTTDAGRLPGPRRVSAMHPLPAAVLYRGSHYEPIHAEDVEGKPDGQRRTVPVKSPVPQHFDASAKPHSAVPNAGSSERTWKMPTAVSDPCGTTAKHTFWPPYRCRNHPADKFTRSLPIVAGGGDRNLGHLFARTAPRTAPVRHSPATCAGLPGCPVRHGSAVRQSVVTVDGVWSVASGNVEFQMQLIAAFFPLQSPPHQSTHPR